MSADQLKASRTNLKRNVTRLSNKLKRATATSEVEANVSEIKQSLQDIFAEFENIHYKYLEAVNVSDEEDDDSYFLSVQETYLDALSSIQEQQPKPKEKDVSKVLAESLAFMQLPKVELQPFDGDPTRYHAFIQVFTESVEDLVQDNHARFTRLLQYTCGKAHQAIKNCALMVHDDEDGDEEEKKDAYTAAREILKKRFGDDYIVMDAIIHGLRDGGPLRSPSEVGEFADMLSTGVAVASGMKKLKELDSQRVIVEINDRLPHHIKVKWRSHAIKKKRKDGVYPGIKCYADFVNEQSEFLADPIYGQLTSSKENTKSQVSAKSTSSSAKSKPVFTVDATSTKSDATSTKSISCILCDDAHYLNQCPKLLEMPLKERYEFILEKRLCRNCLRPNHIASKCKKNSLCKHCKCKHNSVLHDPSFRSEMQTDSTEAKTVQSESVLNVSDCDTRAGLSCVEVLVEGKNALYKCKAIVDAKATVNLCTNRLSKKLGYDTSEDEMSLNVITGLQCVKGEKFVKQVKVFASDLSDFVMVNNLFSVDSIPVSMSSVFTKRDLIGQKHLHGVEITEVTKDDEIDMLIGSGVPKAFHQLEVRQASDSDIVAVKMTLGWDLVGMKRLPSPTPGAVFFTDSVLSLSKSVSPINDDLSSLYKSDFADCSLFDPRKGLSIDDCTAIDLVQKSTVLQDGHFTVGVPWKQDPKNLPSSKNVVRSRLKALEKRFHQDKDLHQAYSKEMKKFLDKGYLEVSSADTDLCHYLPHHPVWHPRKKTLRVVWDCAVSLNDFIFEGPDLINSLTDVLTRFRRFPIVVCSDIQKMYLNVKIPAGDRGAFRILWWPDGDLTKSPIEYRATVHIYGAKSSGYVANHCVKKLAQGADPIVAQTLLQDFYVDDQLSSVQSESDAMNLIQNLRKVLQSGGFKLTKFISNSETVLMSVPQDDLVDSLSTIFGEEEYEHAVLGLKWLVQKDCLCFPCFVPDADSVPTRRLFLSVMAKVYDPLGMVAPAILPGKVVLQQKSSLGWDDTDEFLKEKWPQFHSLILNVSKFMLPRCLIPSDFSKVVHISLHGFSDASNDGYAAVIYARQVDIEGKVCISFIQGKSRVAPKFKGRVPQATVPKLELNAAALMAKLLRKVEKGIALPIDEFHFWTDSQAVLMSIHATDRKFPVYWSNRLAQIYGNSSPQQWHYVPSEENPADVGSRGAQAKNFDRDMLFWCAGPQFLLQTDEFWPKCDDVPVLPAPVVMKIDQEVVPSSGVLSHIIDHYSSLSRLLRVLSKIVCFMKNCQRKDKVKLTVKVADMRDSLRSLIKHEQQFLVIRNLKRLTPFKDETGVWRCKSRLSEANLTFDMKFPIILPKNSHLTRMIIENEHKLSGHMGPHHVHVQLRRKYWIIHGGKTVKAVLSSCIKCRKYNAVPLTQQMSALPVERTASSYPFEFTGVDYFGPFLCKVRRSKVKRYGCIFVCLTTRAVHIEVANSLETSAFLSALTRFIARRGMPTKMYSDNATNFQGAQKELKGILQAASPAVGEFLVSKGIDWHFHPPSASHHGGHYERMIRCVRKVLYGVVTEQEMSEDNLCTFLCETEKILNDRPLTSMSDDLDNVPLTPNVIILLRQNSCGSMFEHSDCKPRQSHRQAQYLASIFWKRFLKEYVSTLSTRQKWLKPKRNLKIGDLVLMSGEGFCRGQWPLAKVVDVHPCASDGLVRSVSIQAGKSVKVRPVTKLALLEAVD